MEWHFNVDRSYVRNGLNQLTSAGATTLLYDSRGNLTGSGTDAYTYTSENRLATGPGGRRGSPAAAFSRARGCSVTALVAGIPFDVAEQELKAARKVPADCPAEAFATRQLSAAFGPGNALLIRPPSMSPRSCRASASPACLPSGSRRPRRAAGYVESGAFADPCLQDQLLLPFAMAGGGAFATVTPSQHSRTAIELIRRFTGVDTLIVEANGGPCRVEVGKR